MRRKLILLTATKGLFLLSAFCFLLSSCQQEEDFAPQGQEQVLRIATRSTSDVNAAESFTDDFTLELWSTTDNAKYETHSMTYTDGTGWNTAKSSILPANAFAYKGSSVIDISYTDKWNYRGMFIHPPFFLYRDL